MADDNTVEISFSASTDDALDGIGLIHDGLTDLTAPVSALSGILGRLGDAFGASLPLDQISQCASSLGTVGTAAQGAAEKINGIGAQIRVMQINLAAQKALLESEVNQFKITQDEKFDILEAEVKNEYAAESKLIEDKLKLAKKGSQQESDLKDKLAVLDAKRDADLLRLNEQSIAAQQALWTGYLSTVTGAFNSQLRGLLEGTTTWHKAMIKMLEDLTIKFIEMVEQMVVKWLAAEIAQTTATTTGAATRAAAVQTASSSGVLAGVANAMHAIMTDAAQAFAGVFAFLAPTMGPAAAGPAAAARASVASAAVFDVGTDYVVRGGLALIHPGETIIPAARGSGPFTGAAMGAQIHAPVSINVSALDSQSVARFFNDNSRHMLRAINDAVKRGAHLGLRAANR
jgi:hypothetical protein